MGRAFDVIVVGNGALANAAARTLTLQDGSVRVALVGPAARPRAASVAAGAMLGCFGECTATLMETALGRLKLDLAYRAAREWPSWVADLNADLPLDQRVVVRPGTFILKRRAASEVEAANFDAILRMIDAHAEPFEEVAPADIAGLRPAEGDAVERSLFLPREDSLDSGALLRAYVAQARLGGRITLIDDTARSIDTHGDRLAGVTLGSGEPLVAGQVVVAAGADSQALVDGLPDLARRIPRLFPGGGCSLVLETDASPAAVLRTPNQALAFSLHAVPRGEGRVYLGATNRVLAAPLEAPVDSDVRLLREVAARQLHGAYADASTRVVAVNAGNRPVTVDGCPLIGETSLQGLWLMTGTYRDGLHLSPLLARELARRMFGEAPRMQHPFGPERRPLALRTQAEAVEDVVRSAQGEDGGRSAEAVRAAATRVYEEIGSEHVLPPEFLPLIERDPARWIPFFKEHLAQLWE